MTLYVQTLIAPLRSVLSGVQYLHKHDIVHRDLKSDEDRAARGFEEKMQAMEMETARLHKMLQDAGQRAETAQQELLQTRKHAAEIPCIKFFSKAISDRWHLQAQAQRAPDMFELNEEAPELEDMMFDD